MLLLLVLLIVEDLGGLRRLLLLLLLFVKDLGGLRWRLLLRKPSQI